MFEGQEIKFPVKWNFRIIVKSEFNPTAEIISIMEKNGFVAKPSPGNISSSGTYRTWKVGATFNSKLELDKCAEDLRTGISGLKYMM